jgi:cysteine desulfurase
VYVDNAASTPVRAEVLDAMIPYFVETFANASSVHALGQTAKKALEDARGELAACIGAQAREICFTSGGTESNNIAVRGTALANAGKGRHIVTSAVEHRSVLNCCEQLKKEGFEVTVVPVDRFGVVDLESIEKAVRPDTIMVSVMLANNETGTLQPVADISKFARNRGIAVHTDAVQAVGKAPVNVGQLDVDLLSLSGHKIGGPKGAGALYVRRGTRLASLFQGGHQEGGLRPGTENLACIVGLAKAVALASRDLDGTGLRLGALRDRLQRAVTTGIPGVHLNGHPAKRLPNILNLAFDGVEAETLLVSLDISGIAASAGSACESRALEASHVLRAMGLDEGRIRSSVRFSVWHDNTAEEMDYVAESLAEAVSRLRGHDGERRSSRQAQEA